LGIGSSPEALWGAALPPPEDPDEDIASLVLEDDGQQRGSHTSRSSAFSPE
jgi:hypothetical protein